MTLPADTELVRTAQDLPDLQRRLKRLIVEALRLEGLDAATIGDDQPLFGEGLGLDSIDALELAGAIEREFRIAVPDGRIEPEVFHSPRTLAVWLAAQLDRREPGAPH
ncbi:MAG: phosphopantetheine-binding protein [Thermoanaerobaculia bacterium]